MQGRVSSNLSHFLELALDMDAGRYPSLMRFLESLREMREHPLEAPDEPPAGGNDDRVQILTIHAAKGLEAPVVFLVDTAVTPGDHSTHGTLVDWPVEADRPNLFMLTPRSAERDSFCRHHLDAHRAAEAREEANLLYVAVTRARQVLYVSGTRSTRGNYDDSPWARMVRALGLDEDEADSARVVCENGRFPTTARGDDTCSTAASPVDDALCRPLNSDDSWSTEIAPSRTDNGADSGVAAAGGDEDGRLRGTLIHRLLQLRTEAAVDDADILRRVALEQGLAPDHPLLRECDDEARAVLATPALAHLFDPAARAWNEVPLHFEHEGRVVHGIVDRLVDDGDTLWVVDYKSHRQARAETLSEIAAHYREQMRWYAEGARRLWPERQVRPVLVFTACREALPLDT